ncbi:MAG: phosphotransferase [Oscillospiraceae bacterium]|jgi:hypothetical protein|nr:phosphotransferase [Oscillospiraceae bacterium]
MLDTEKILALYGANGSILKTIDTSRGDADARFTFAAAYPNGQRLAIKAARNAWTNAQRVCGWAMLEEHYNRLGIYAPRIVPNVYNQLSYELDGYVVYAETWVTDRILEKLEEKNADLDAAAIETIGILAANPAPLVPWVTSYSLLDVFEPSDPCDEWLSNARKMQEFFNKYTPQYAARMREIMIVLEEKRQRLEPLYRALPRAVFQGDMNGTNIIVDERGKFKGLIDFNLSGTEPILHYAFCECYAPDETLEDTSFAATAHNFTLVGRHYRFTEMERDVMNLYYNVIAPFLNFPIDLEDHRDAPDYWAERTLDYIEREMTRSDAHRLLPP